MSDETGTPAGQASGDLSPDAVAIAQRMTMLLDISKNHQQRAESRCSVPTAGDANEPGA